MRIPQIGRTLREALTLYPVFEETSYISPPLHYTQPEQLRSVSLVDTDVPLLRDLEHVLAGRYLSLFQNTDLVIFIGIADQDRSDDMQSGFLNLLQIRIQQKIALFDMVSGSNMCREGPP